MEKLSGPEQPDLRAFRSLEKYTQAYTQAPLPSSLPGQLCKSHTARGPGRQKTASERPQFRVTEVICLGSSGL